LRREDDLVSKDVYFFTWLHNGHLDVKRGHFVGQAIAVAFKRPRRCAIHRHARSTNVAAYPAQQDYVTIVLGPKKGKDSFDEIHMAKEDDLELTTDEIKGCGAS
jgi:hypothetical protein